MPVIFIPFGPWEPDAAQVNSGVLSAANKVYPSSFGYTYMPSISQISNVTALAPLTGGVVIQTSSAGAYSLYYGTTNIIRRIDSSDLNSATTIATSTQPTAPALWSFAKFGTKLIACHAGVDPLYEDWSVAAAAMSTLGGSPPRARGVFTVGDFVFLAGLASNPRSLAWSGINDSEGWTPGTNLSDTQEFPDGGDVLGVAGDKTGYVIQQNAIRRFQFLPGDTATIFQFDKAQDIPGCVGPHAWAVAGQTLFYYSEEGFCSFGPGGFRRIGAHRVDVYFKVTKQPSIAYTKAVADPYGPRIFFSHDLAGDGSDNGFLVYDWMLDRWSEDASGAGFFFNHLDATGGGAQIAGSNGGIARLSGTNSGATVETCDLELFQSGANAGQRALVTSVRPAIYGSVGTVTARGKELLTASPTSSTSTTQEANGRFSVNKSGLYHSISVLASAISASPSNGNEKYLKGVAVWVEPAGEA